MSDARQRTRTPVVELSVDGRVGTAQRDRTTAQITSVLEAHGVDATAIHIRLEQSIAHPRRPAHGRATAEVPGHTLIVHADADTLDEVTTLLAARLRQRLDHTLDRRRTRRRRGGHPAAPRPSTDTSSADRAATRKAG